jgi:predicted glycoside hydrolase/deacetylase ChbG (UPF0249 family)
MEATLHRSPHTADEVAQARTVVTHFDDMLRTHGATEACELRETAWSILLADHAARLLAKRRAQLRRITPGDAA